MAAAGNPARIQLILQGARQTISGLQQTSASVGGLGSRVRQAGEEMEKTSGRGFLMNQTLFTLRRFAYAGTLALVGMAGALSKLGFTYNMTIENNSVALRHFLGSQQVVNKELDYLYKLAATTPFEFSDVTSATRRFLAFGYSLQEANKYLAVIGDTVAGMGGGAAEIERMVLVFGQIRASGRLLGQDMLQLEQQGVPAIEILQKQLGLTGQQLSHIGNLAIPASVAIPALMRGMADTFKGSAAEQAKTLSGQLSTLHDYAAQLMGTLTLPLYDRFRRHIIPQISKVVGDMQKYAKQQEGEGRRPSITGLVGVTDKDLNLGGRLVHFWQLLVTYLDAGSRIFRSAVLPAIKDVSIAFGAFLTPLMIAGNLLQLVSHHTTLLRIAITYLLAIYAAEKAMMLISIILLKRSAFARILDYEATRRQTAAVALQNWYLIIQALRYNAVFRAYVLNYFWNLRLVRALRFLALATRSVIIWTWASTAATRAYIGTQIALARFTLYVARVALMNFIRSMAMAVAGLIRLAITNAIVVGMMIAEWLGLDLVVMAAAISMAAAWIIAFWPVALTIALLAAVAVGVYFLWRNWKWVMDHIKMASMVVWDWIKGHWRLLASILGGPFVALGLYVQKHFAAIKKVFIDFWNWTKRISGDILGVVKKIWHWSPLGMQARGVMGLAHLVGLQEGGHITAGGAFLVGERGPEIAVLPAGAAVSPIATGGSGYSGLPIEMHITVISQLDGKKVAEAQAKRRLDVKARR